MAGTRWTKSTMPKRESQVRARLPLQNVRDFKVRVVACPLHVLRAHRAAPSQGFHAKGLARGRRPFGPDHDGRARHSAGVATTEPTPGQTVPDGDGPDQQG